MRQGAFHSLKESDIFASALRFHTDRCDSSKANCGPRLRFQPIHPPAKALQSQSLMRRNPVLLHRILREKEYPKVPARQVWAAVRRENAAPRPTPSHAARSRSRRTRARSSSSAVVLPSVRIPFDLLLNCARAKFLLTLKTTGDDACR